MGKKSPEWWWLKDLEGKARKQRKVQGPEWEPQVKQTMLLPKPNLHRTGGGRGHIKRGAKALFSLSLRPCAMGRSSLCVFWLTCPQASKVGFSCYYLNRAVTLIYLRAITLRAVTCQGALMSITPNFCCDETKNWGTYTRVTSSTSFTLGRQK